MHGAPLSVSPLFTFKSEHVSERLNRGMQRHSAKVQRVVLASPSDRGDLTSCTVVINSSTERLELETVYNYSVVVSGSKAIITAHSVYGAMVRNLEPVRANRSQYGMESLTQLVELSTGVLPHSFITIDDAPQYTWRGLMIDAGRR